MPLKAYAPGSVMLLGEYAVLHGYPALVCAIDKRIMVTLTPRLDNQIEISSTLGNHSTQLSTLKIIKPFHFVLAVLKHYQKKIKTGCDIKIESEFSHQVGLGSSAAVTVATLAALNTWLELKLSPEKLIKQGCKVIRLIQGRGSGADIAASVYGGLIRYTAHPLKIKKFSITYPFTLLFAGFKTPTAQVIQLVQHQFTSLPSLFKSICASIGQCAVQGSQCIEKSDWENLGKVMTIQQGLMQALGVSTPLLNNMLEELHHQPQILGAKISGSGLGDCVIGLGDARKLHVDKRYQQAAMSLQGVYCEKI